MNMSGITRPVTDDGLPLSPYAMRKRTGSRHVVALLSREKQRAYVRLRKNSVATLIICYPLLLIQIAAMN